MINGGNAAALREGRSLFSWASDSVKARPVKILQRTFLDWTRCFHSHGLDFHSRVLLCRSMTGRVERMDDLALHRARSGPLLAR